MRMRGWDGTCVAAAFKTASAAADSLGFSLEKYVCWPFVGGGCGFRADSVEAAGARHIFRAPQSQLPQPWRPSAVEGVGSNASEFCVCEPQANMVRIEQAELHW